MIKIGLHHKISPKPENFALLAADFFFFFANFDANSMLIFVCLRLGFLFAYFKCINKKHRCSYLHDF